MKLYANIKSERAEKGQGGNEYLEIEITDSDRREIASLKIIPGGLKNNILLHVDDKLADFGISDGNICKCPDPICAKCLLANCKDPNCVTHPDAKKREFREMYKNR